MVPVKLTANLSLVKVTSLGDFPQWQPRGADIYTVNDIKDEAYQAIKYMFNKKPLSGTLMYNNKDVKIN